MTQNRPSVFSPCPGGGFSLKSSLNAPSQKNNFTTKGNSRNLIVRNHFYLFKKSPGL
jgi:hypothetical protein